MSDLPAGWTETTLGEIASQGQYGWTSKAAEKGRVKYLRTTDITSGHLNWDTVPYCQDNPTNVEKYKIEPGDILISRAGSVGFSALIEDVPSTPAVFASYLIRYIPNSQVNPKFIARFLQSPNYWQQISDASAGIALANVNAKKLANVILPLPPLNEQKRIAERLDSLLTRVDSCQTHLERVPQILKRFRESVLAAATSGRLTEDWREEKGIEYNWRKVKFTDIGTLGRGKSKHRPRNDKRLYGGDYPFIQTGDIAQSNGWITSHSQTYSEFGLKQSKLWSANTVCITIAANIANTAILSYPACFPDSVVGFIADPEKSLPQFVKWSIDVIKNDLETYAPATAQKNINLGILQDVQFDCPPLDEQAEIVRRVEKLFAYAAKLEARYTSASEHVERLTPSLLAKAFRGELVEQEEGDEPAHVLLERIRESIANAPKETKEVRRRSEMKDTKKILKKGERMNVVQALQEAGKELSSEQLFVAVGYPADAESDLVEEFLVEIRDALKNQQIKRRRRDNLDLFSLAK